MENTTKIVMKNEITFQRIRNESASIGIDVISGA